MDLRLRAVALSAFLIFSGSLLGCKDRESPETKIRKLIQDTVRAANEKKVGDIVDQALPDFRGPRGANLQECRRILLGYFLQQGWIKVFVRSLDIQVDQQKAHATLDLLLARGNPVENIEDVIPTDATELRFEIDLVEKDGAWKYEKAEYHHKR